MRFISFVAQFVLLGYPFDYAADLIMAQSASLVVDEDHIPVASICGLVGTLYRNTCEILAAPFPLCARQYKLLKENLADFLLRHSSPDLKESSFIKAWRWIGGQWQEIALPPRDFNE